MSDIKWQDVLLNVELTVLNQANAVTSLDVSSVEELVHSELSSVYVKELVDLYKCLTEGEFTLNSNTVNMICEEVVKSSSKETVQDVLDALKNTINLKTEPNNDADSRILSIIILFVAIIMLQEFIKCNWTGPCREKMQVDPLSEKLFCHLPDYKSEIDELMRCDTECLSGSVRGHEHLLLCKNLIHSLHEKNCVTKKWWLFRCLMLQQMVLMERSAQIHDEITEIVEQLNVNFVHEDENTNFFSRIELGLFHLYYHEVARAKHFFTDARNSLGMEVQLCGAFGKRTKHQSKPVAQLFIKLNRNSNSDNCNLLEHETEDLPKNISLQDDVLLNEVSFMDNNEVVHDLLIKEQIVLLSESCFLLKSNASDELLKEQIMAYVTCLLDQQNTFCIQLKALFLRCRLEKHKSRKVERAMMQLEELTSSIKRDSGNPRTRLYTFYCTLFPPHWCVQKELADLLMSLGAVKSALEIFQSLDLWEDIVKCYQVLEQNENAAALVRQKIEEEETPTLWCILGDVTDDITCYKKAWELSNHKSARAQRCLGYFYYKKRDYKNCIPFFKKSVEINHMQLNVWFSLAFAASQAEDFELAAKAYRHVLNLDPDNFEAWNNLSNAYIKLKQKDRAYRTLQEALKCNYENWKVWENYLLVCIDVGAFDDAIQAYHRIIDIKGKHDDVEILAIIVRAVTDDLDDFTGQPTSRLKSTALKLFGRLTSIITNNADIWKLYAKLHSSDPDYLKDHEILERVLNYLQKAHKYRTYNDFWAKDVASCKKVLCDVLELLDVYVAYVKLVEDGVKLQTKTSARFMLRNVLARIEKHKQDFSKHEIEELDSQIELLKQRLLAIESA